MRAQRLLIDTNLLVLLMVGTASTAFIAGHKRTRAYTVEDFETLKILLARAGSLATTPCILAETSNLVRQFAMPGRAAILDAVRDFVMAAEEIYLPSAQAVIRLEFQRLGLTDTAALAIRERDVTLLTDDLALFVACIAAGNDALNFSHERRSPFG